MLEGYWTETCRNTIQSFLVVSEAMFFTSRIWWKQPTACKWKSQVSLWITHTSQHAHMYVLTYRVQHQSVINVVMSPKSGRERLAVAGWLVGKPATIWIPQLTAIPTATLSMQACMHACMNTISVSHGNSSISYKCWGQGIQLTLKWRVLCVWYLQYSLTPTTRQSKMPTFFWAAKITAFHSSMKTQFGRHISIKKS